MSNLPIRKTLVKAHLTPAYLVKEINSGLKDSTGEIYNTIRDKYAATIEKIPSTEFTRDVDLAFRNKLLKTIKDYNFKNVVDRKGFCNYIYQIDLAGEGMKVF